MTPMQLILTQRVF